MLYPDIMLKEKSMKRWKMEKEAIICFPHIRHLVLLHNYKRKLQIIQEK
jgi:hypothetical protein